MGVRILLSPKELPKQWYNILPDLPKQLAPAIHPKTKQPITADDLLSIFPESLIEQETSSQRWIEIPESILQVYSIWRPTPLCRAQRLEQFLQTPAQIWFKHEGVSPSGSHKLNTAVAQAYYNKKAGVKKLTTETGAGQWGSALAFASNLFGLDCIVYMVKVSYQQKPYRRVLMQTWGAKVFASPTERTQAGRKLLAEDPDSPGSLGIAISEAVEEALQSDDTKYSLGSVLNHVLLHQTVIGLEAKKQFEQAGIYPDILIACASGGSNFSGFSFPFIADKLAGKRPNLRVIAVEPKAAPSLTAGVYAYDFGDTVGLTPILKMYTLGHDFIPPPIQAGGLLYHGISPIVSLLYDEGIIEAVAYPQRPVLESAILFAKTEGIIPAPESSHAIRAAIDEALNCKQTKESKIIAFNVSGHGYLDLLAYDEYLQGKLDDAIYDPEQVKRALEKLPV